jgi:adenylate cyclase
MGRKAWIDWLRFTPFKSGVLVIVAAVLLFLYGNDDFQRVLRGLDNRLVDWMFHCRTATPPGNEVVIVDIDEKSLLRHGQWPWPRTRLAELVRQIGRHHPKVIGLDIFFPEADRTSPKNYLPLYREYLKSDAELPEWDNDRHFGSVLGQYPVILGYLFVMRKDGIAPGTERPFPMCNVERLSHDQPYEFIQTYRPILNRPEIARDVRSEGFFNTFLDDAAMVRTIPLFLEYGGVPYPSLALEMLREGWGESGYQIRSSAAGIVGVRLGRSFIPTDYNARMTLNWRGKARSFRYLSASEVLSGKVPEAELRDKFVLVGCSAGALHDLRATPLATTIPGVEIHATMIDNVLRGDFLHFDRKLEAAMVLSLIIVGGLLLTAVLAYGSPLAGSLAALLSLCFVTFGGYGLFSYQGLIVGLTFPVISLLVLLVVVSLVNYFQEGREKQFVRKAFSHYVSDDVVGELMRNPEKLRLEGEVKELTVMFSDIRGFTSISEKLPPQELSGFLNEYLTAMTEVILAHGGTVDKFIGDAIMAFWGAPVGNARHAADAAECALKMLSRLAELQASWQARDMPIVEIGIGLNTGVMTVGNLGSRDRFDYTVIGDSVNLASRLEGLNKVYGTKILVSEHSKTAVGEGIFWRFVDRVRVKGKTEPISVYEPLAMEPVSDELRREVRCFDDMVAACRQRRFGLAIEQLAELVDKHPDPLYRFYQKRVEVYRIAPPPASWDGVFIHRRK